MKATYIQEGNNINYINLTETEIEAGSVIVFGVSVGIAASNIAPNEMGALAMKGIYEMPKDDTDIKAGSAVYYNKTADKVTSTAANNTKIGIAAADAGTSAVTVNVKINA